MRSKRRSVRPVSGSTSPSAIRAIPGASCWRSNATARPITRRFGRESATACARRCWKVSAGASIAFGARIGFIGATNNCASSRRRSTPRAAIWIRWHPRRLWRSPHLRARRRASDGPARQNEVIWKAGIGNASPRSASDACCVRPACIEKSLRRRLEFGVRNRNPSGRMRGTPSRIRR